MEKRKKRAYICEIMAVERLKDDVVSIWIKNREMAELAKPGCFLHISVDGVYLRRPIAICDVKENLLRFVFIVRGHGTRILSQMKTGGLLNILGPLGNGFQIQENALIIGGGAGIFPLYYLAKEIKQKTVVLGFRDRESVFFKEEFEKICDNVIIATEDGSFGFFGNACQAAMGFTSQASIVYACGPMPMLEAVKNLGLPCQISLEERMGCGIGACLVCVCKKNGSYERVCCDGPVFWGNEVELEY